MRADHADGIAVHEAADDELAAGQPIVRVGAGEQFVEQKQHRHFGVGQVRNQLDAVNLGVEAGDAAGERVEHADGCCHHKRR